MRIQRCVLSVGGLTLACQGGLAAVAGFPDLVSNRLKERQSIDNGGFEDTIEPDTDTLPAVDSPFPALPPIISGAAAFTNVVPGVPSIGLTSGRPSPSDAQTRPSIRTATSIAPITSVRTVFPSSQASPISGLPVPEPVFTFTSTSNLVVEPFTAIATSFVTETAISTVPSTSTIPFAAAVPAPLPPFVSPPSNSSTSSATSAAVASSSDLAVQAEEAAAASSSTESNPSSGPTELPISSALDNLSDSTSTRFLEETVPSSSAPSAVPQQVMPATSMSSAVIAATVLSVITALLAICAIAFYLTRRRLHGRRRSQSPESPPLTPSSEDKNHHKRYLSGSTLQSTGAQIDNTKYEESGLQDKEEGVTRGEVDDSHYTQGKNDFAGFDFGGSWPASTEGTILQTANGNIGAGAPVKREELARRSVLGRVYETEEEHISQVSRSTSALSSNASVKSKGTAKLSLFPTSGSKKRRTMTTGEAVVLASNF